VGHEPTNAPPTGTTHPHQVGIVTQLLGSLVGHEGEHRIHCGFLSV
jgi:hypothetical protein